MVEWLNYYSTENSIVPWRLNQIHFAFQRTIILVAGRISWHCIWFIYWFTLPIWSGLCLSVLRSNKKKKIIVHLVCICRHEWHLVEPNSSFLLGCYLKPRGSVSSFSNQLLLHLYPLGIPCNSAEPIFQESLDDQRPSSGPNIGLRKKIPTLW